MRAVGAGRRGDKRPGAQACVRRCPAWSTPCSGRGVILWKTGIVNQALGIHTKSLTNLAARRRRRRRDRACLSPDRRDPWRAAVSLVDGAFAVPTLIPGAPARASL